MAKRQVEQGLSDEVTIAHGVERVLEARREAEVLGDAVGVEGERGPGERASAERGDVHPHEGVEHPVKVPGERPGVGEEMVREEHRLRALQVRVARQVQVARLARPAEKHLLQPEHIAGDLSEAPAREEA